MLAATLAWTPARAADRASAGQWFVFGRQPRAGFTSVHADTAYSPERHYGFLGAAPGSRDHSVCGDGKPFVFVVDVPEGNYDVAIKLGDDASDSVTTLKAEARRLILERAEVGRGRTKKFSFTVNVRYKELRNGETVRLKPDEQDDFDWDHRLELEFNNSHPCLRSLEIRRNNEAITVYIAGDSTVTDQRREPWAAWGQMLPAFFREGVAIANHAESGESLKSFIGERRLPKLLETIRSGDYLFIQFAHNDQKAGSSHVNAFTTYQEYLKLYIDEARKRGAIPVLVTSMHRRRFDADGKIANTLDDYPEAMRQLASREQVALIDLNAASKTLFETLGPDGTLKVFVHYPADSFPGQATPLTDNTHFNAYGAYELARCVVEGIRKAKLAIAKYLRDDVRPFDPAHPDPVTAWNLPPSPEMTAHKPEGN